MSQNDVIALNANFENWKEDRATGLDPEISPFVYYCSEQFIKSYNLSDEEIQYGITDGPNDGEVDAIYFLVANSLVRQETKLDTKSDKPKVNLVIMQMKHSGGFSPIEISKLDSFTNNLLALSEEASGFKAEYHPELIEIMQVFKEKYLQIAGNFPELKIDYYYISKIDEQQPDMKAEIAADKVKATVKSISAKQHLPSILSMCKGY